MARGLLDVLGSLLLAVCVAEALRLVLRRGPGMGLAAGVRPVLREVAEPTFAGVSVSSRLRDSLQRAKLHEPTAIQQSAIAPLCSGLSALVHASTGTGKTLAYLFPVLRSYTADPRAWIRPMQALVLVPTKELALQVASDLRVLLNSDDCVSLCVSTDKALTVAQLKPIVVGTAQKIWTLLRRASATDSQLLRHLRYLVLDEVDRLADLPSRFGPAAAEPSNSSLAHLAALLRSVHPDSMPLLSRLQVVGASATLGRPLRRELLHLFAPNELHADALPFLRAAPSQAAVAQSMDAAPATTRAVTIPAGISHLVLQVPAALTLPARLALLQTVLRDNPALTRALVIVPHQQDVDQAVAMLRFWRVGDVRSVLMEKLGHAAAVSGDRGARTVLVTAASSARGLHFPSLDLVFLAEAPITMDEYLHLAGRTGRTETAHGVARGVAVTLADPLSCRRMEGWQTALRIRLRVEPAF